MNPETNSKKVSAWSVVTLLLGAFSLTYFITFFNGSSLYSQFSAISAILAIVVGLASLIIFRKRWNSISKVTSVIGILFGIPVILCIIIYTVFIFRLSPDNDLHFNSSESGLL